MRRDQLCSVALWMAEMLLALPGCGEPEKPRPQHADRPAERPRAPPKPLLPGTWTGVIEGFEQGEGRIELRLRDSEGLQGEVLFQAPADPGPPVQFSVDASSMQARGLAARIFGQVPYTVRGVRIDGNRLQFALAGHEPWDTFCRGRRSFDTGQGWSCVAPGYREAHGWCTGVIDGKRARISCAEACICQRPVCTCDEDGCRANEALQIWFDLEVVGAQARGSVAGLGDKLLKVSLERDR